MKQTTKMSRAVSQLEHIYNALNADFFAGEPLPVPIITVQSKPGTYGQCTTAKVWQRKDGGAEPLTNQGVGDALRTDTFLAIVQKQTVSAIVVAALPHQPPGRPVLLIGHVWDFGCAHFTRSLCKILKASDLRF